MLSFHISTATPTAHIQLNGELDEHTVASFGAQLAMLIRTGHRELYLDGTQLDRVSPVCVGVLNRAAEGLSTAGSRAGDVTAGEPGGLTISGLDAETVAVLRAAGLHASVRLGDEPNEPDQRTSIATV